MAKFGWAGEQPVTSDSPPLYTNLYYYVSRSGNTVTYSLGVKVWTTSANGWRNNRWGCQFTVNGTALDANCTVKKQTSGKIGTTPYWPNSTTPGANSHANTDDVTYLYQNKTTTVSSNATTMKVTVRLKDTGFGTGMTGKYSWGTPVDDWGDFDWDIPIDLPSYTVSYNANGGNATPGNQTVTSGTTITLANAISKNNTDTSGTLYLYYNANGGSGEPRTQSGTYVNTTPYYFSKWAEGSVNGTKYNAGANYTVTSNVTMYATWSTGTTYRKTNPTIRISSTTPSRAYYTFLGWNTNSGAASASYSPGSNITISGNTTLYAIWRPNPPTNLQISRTGSNTTSISVSVGATGLTMTNYTLYYRVKNSGNYVAKSLGTSTTGTITGLAVDTDYQIYFTATNAGGTSTSGVVVYSTTLNNPSLTNPVKSNTFPFMTTITATGSVTPSRTLTYAFSKDGGSTWTGYQSSNSYHWTGLNEETTYNMGVRVKATHVGVNASDTTATKYVSVTTPTNQARMRIKKDGQWKKGRTFIKVDGVWKKADKIYIKVNGAWVENKNFYDGEPSLWD